MATATISLPPKLLPVFTGTADVRGAYGGRGSGKTRSFAKMSAVRGYMWSMAGREGIILCARQFMNSLADSSLEEIKAAIRSEPWLAAHYEIGEKYIRTKDGRVSYAFCGLDRNIDSIKSKARILLGWVDEAEPVTEEAWVKLIPTLREEDSELWVTWNPERKTSPTHKRFRESTDPRFKVVEMNWRDNPRFPAKLERDRQRDMVERPDQYEHIWEGGFKTVFDGAYYAEHLTRAKQEGRIGRVAADPLMTIRLFVDIGGTGAKADAFTIWAAQFIGREIRVLNYYEAVGQPLATHLAWCRENGYTPDRAQFWLPHDGATNDKVFAVSYESALREAGYKVTVVPNQGAGAAKFRIEAARRLFPAIWFNADTTEAGRDALGAYHEKKDEKRGIGLGPNHDWASHGSDSFGLMCVVYEEPKASAEQKKQRPRIPTGAGGWMGM
jgi:phage terminase large subunit